MTLTSDTAPIRVDFVPREAHGLSGQLGLTFAPGKKDPAGQFAAWDRDLAADLGRLATVFHVNLLVSLVEEAELTLLAITDLVAVATAHGIDVLRHPIPDGGAPQLAGAQQVVTRVLAALELGHTVVVHCRGGMGRAGTIAAATLIARGLPPAEAIATVRAARRGAIETRVQEEFLGAFQL